LICLLAFGVGLVLVVTGLYLWWIHTDWGRAGTGGGLGLGGGRGRRGPYIVEGYSLTRFMKDIHLYAGFAFMAFCGLHMACNWKAMKRHLGLEDASSSAVPPRSAKNLKQSIPSDK
jgi:hypothetical protein